MNSAEFSFYFQIYFKSRNFDRINYIIVMAETITISCHKALIYLTKDQLLGCEII